MDDQQALRIVASLANGVDPDTGEVFPESSPYQRPTTIRALFKVQRILETGQHPAGAAALVAPSGSQVSGASGDMQRKRNSASPNAGKPWSADEDRQLLAMFDADKSLTEIAQAHARTVGGVRARLEKHGRLEPSPATRWPGSSHTAAN